MDNYINSREFWEEQVKATHKMKRFCIAKHQHTHLDNRSEKYCECIKKCVEYENGKYDKSKRSFEICPIATHYGEVPHIYNL